MSSNLQRKFAKGCNYNMKIVIRGDKNTGKSCLLARLQGKQFVEEYSPTEEIQVASINWSYKNTEDVVKVEVWDVVDVAKKRTKISGLKMSSNDGAASSESDICPGLDAEFLDVYQGTHGVIILLDITKSWTMDYMKKEVEKIPSHIPVLVLANFCDQAHHRQVTQLQIADCVQNIVRSGNELAEVRWAELSLRNGFGLKFLHKFFNVPFLTLQRQSLLQQLEINSRDIVATQAELDLYMESDEANYQLYSDGQTVKRRVAAEQVAPSPSASIVVGQPSNTVDPNKTVGLTPAQSNLPFSNKPQEATPTKLDVDNFVPDSADFDNFLNEEDSEKSKNPTNTSNNVDSSSDDECDNPMVARYEDSVDVGNYEIIKNGPALNEDTSDDDEVVTQLKINNTAKQASPVIFPSNTELKINNTAKPATLVISPTNDYTPEVGEDLEDFLNDSDTFDNTIQSFTTAYEVL